MTPEENKARVRQAFNEIMNKGNLSAVDEYLAPDFVGYFSNAPAVQGREGFKQFISMWLAAFSPLSVTVDDALAEGDKVVARVTFRGTHTGPLMNIPPTGRQVVTTGLNIFRLVDGKTVEQRAMSDDLGLMQQLGVIPAPAQP